MSGSEETSFPAQVEPAPPGRGESAPPGRGEPAPPGRGEVERMMRDIQQLMSEHEFDSIGEAKSFMEELVGKPLPFATADGDDLSRAQDLCYQAMEADSSNKVKTLVSKALEISPDCADAYLLLSELETPNSESEFSLVEQAVHAGERALGPTVLEEDAGYFWGLLETRPYMRARLRQAEILANRGQNDEAIIQCWDLLRLNPSDNQGVRYPLCDFLFVAGNDEDILKLLDQYEDDVSTEWSYSLALVLFRTEGESERANHALDDALKDNRHVPAFLFGRKKPADFLSNYVNFGSQEEAAGYGLSGTPHWRDTYGAVRWLRQRSRSRALSR